MTAFHNNEAKRALPLPSCPQCMGCKAYPPDSSASWRLLVKARACQVLSTLMRTRDCARASMASAASRSLQGTHAHV